MSELRLRLQKGAKIQHLGKEYKVSNPITVKVFKGVTIAQEMPVKAEQKSDQAQPIDKTTVCSIIQKEIDKLEVAENKILFSIDEDESEERTFEEHVNATNQIMSFKRLLKKMKAL